RIPHPDIKFLGPAVGILKTLGFIWRRRHEFELIHIHGVGFTAAAIALASQFTGHKVVVHLTGSETYRYIYKSRWRRVLVWKALHRVDCFVAISSEIKNFLLHNWIPEAKIAAIPYGLELSENFHPGKMARGLGSAAKQKVAIFVGRLVIEKAPEDLLRAWQLVCQQRDDCELWILGDGVLKEKLIALAHQFNLETRVKFFGQTQDVFRYLRQADLFVMSSISEGLSNALLEAMSAGLPVVMTSVGGAVDVIRHEENGLLVPPRDFQSLATAMLRLFDNPALAEKLGKAAKATVREKYSIEIVAKQHVELYTNLIA
ncbi:MAG: glycosyltransferase family 4 protein, partial [candidate division KSB1 bacterium]|nr:glycosyltransferase family 4 protein [candidate division KSB1 bacterium]